MVKLFLAGLVLAFSAQAASIQSIPDWEGHPGSLTISTYDAPGPGGNLLEQAVFNFVVGPGPELVSVFHNTFTVNISNDNVMISILQNYTAPRINFSFLLNGGAATTWFDGDLSWLDPKWQGGDSYLWARPGSGSPEPSTYALMGAGLGLLAFLRRRVTAR